MGGLKPDEQREPARRNRKNTHTAALGEGAAWKAAEVSTKRAPIARLNPAGSRSTRQSNEPKAGQAGIGARDAKDEGWEPGRWSVQW